MTISTLPLSQLQVPVYGAGMRGLLARLFGYCSYRVTEEWVDGVKSVFLPTD